MIAWEDPAGDDLLIHYNEDNDIFYQMHGFEENIKQSTKIPEYENIDHSPIVTDDEDENKGN